MFKLEKEIKSKNGVIHFRRWKIFKLFNLTFYIHEILKADSDPYLHNHPWNYFSLVLKGNFIEKTIVNNHIKYNDLKPFSWNYRNYNQYHKIWKLKSDKVYTLFITGKRINPNWSYLINGNIVNFDFYRKNKHLFLK